MPGAPETSTVVLINVFTVEPENQQRLIDIVTAATRGSVDQEPGFISATLHRSLDGAKVTMYARWRDAEAYAAMRARPGRPFLAQALEIATFEPGMYEVVETFLAPKAWRRRRRVRRRGRWSTLRCWPSFATWGCSWRGVSRWRIRD